MCGLFGYTGKAKSYGKLERFMKVLALETSSRGTDATGFAALRDDGSFIGSKAAQPASTYVFKDSTFGEAWAMEPRLFIGHCRLATHGDKANNMNNHPHWSKDRMLAIVHNGIVFAHDALAKNVGATLKGDCDSEVILRMVENAISPGEKHPYDRLVDLAQHLEDYGAMFSVLVLDKARRSVWTFRNLSNPLVFWESKELGVTVFASELEHIKGAASIIFGKKAARAVKAFSPEPGVVFRFNDRGGHSTSKRRAVCTPASTSYSRYSTYDEGWTRGWVDPTKKNDDGKIIPSSWNTKNPPIADIELPHTKECTCVDCAIARTQDHPGTCICAECLMIFDHFSGAYGVSKIDVSEDEMNNALRLMGDKEGD